MTKERQNQEKADLNIKELRVRLDAIVLLLLASKFSDDKGKIKLGEVAPILHLAGYTPTEIARFFGKNKAQQVAPYLYQKKKKN